MPFGGESFPDEKIKFEGKTIFQLSPMPFGGESFPDKAKDQYEDNIQDASPMPFGGESFPDYHQSLTYIKNNL